MYVDRILYPVCTLGPGQRVALWTSGCSKRCPGCANPELWNAAAYQEVPLPALTRALSALHDRYGVTRLTVTGGDPLEQPVALASLLESVRPWFSDVLLYTGYELAHVMDNPGLSDAALAATRADVIIDGPYIAALNDGCSPLRGSTNQAIHYHRVELRNEYESYMRTGRHIQNIVYEGRALSVGIHNGECGTI